VEEEETKRVNVGGVVVLKPSPRLSRRFSSSSRPARGRWRRRFVPQGLPHTARRVIDHVSDRHFKSKTAYHDVASNIHQVLTSNALRTLVF
jgi:hypothetical protein